MAEKKTYRARGTVAIAEGRQYVAGEEIGGKFNARDVHNAALIEEGLITASTSRSAADEGSGDPEGAETPESPETGGESSEPAAGDDADEKAKAEAEEKVAADKAKKKPAKRR